MSHTYEHARPALTVDCVVFGVDEAGLQLLLIQRNLAPHAGHWALPGGFVHTDETLEEAASRELDEETGLRGVFLEQLFTFGAVGRDAARTAPFNAIELDIERLFLPKSEATIVNDTANAEPTDT